MSDVGLRALEVQLGAPAPPTLEGLPDAALQDLAVSVRQARHRQAAELASAGDKALALVPRMLRAPIRRMLG